MAGTIFGARIDLTVNKSNKSAFSREIQEFVDIATKDRPVKISNFKFDLNSGQRTTLAKSLTDALEGAQFDIKLNSIKADGAIKNLREQLNTMMKGLTVEGVKAFVGDIDIGSGKKSGGGATKLTDEAKAAKKELRTLQSQLNSLQKKINGLGVDNTSFKKLTEGCRELRREIETAMEAAGKNDTSAVDGLNTRVAKLAQNYRDADEAAKQSADSGVSAALKQTSVQQQAVNLLQHTQKYIGNNTRAYAAYGAQFEAIIKGLGDIISGDELDPNAAVKLAELRLQLSQLKTSADAAGMSGLTLGERFKKGIEKFGGWAAVTATISKTVALIKKMSVAVKEVDDAMTELKKVTDLTAGAYDLIYVKSVKTAKAVGASIADVITSTADFAKLGFSSSDAAQLAEAALIYKNVGDGVSDITVASESLISTMKGFGLEAENAMHIVDAFNEVGRLCPAA